MSLPTPRRGALFTGNSNILFLQPWRWRWRWHSWAAARAAMIATPFLSSPLVGIFTLKLPNIIRPDNISCFCFNLLHLNFKGDEHLTACTTNICTVLMKLRRGTANSVPRWADEAMQKSFYQSPAEQMCSPVDHKYSHARQSSITTMNR